MSVVELKERDWLDGQLPQQVGPVTLHGVNMGPMWSVAPYAGKQAACVQALAKVAIEWPEQGRATAGAMWFGLGQVMVQGAVMPAMPAAVTDQSDAWACISVKGDAIAVLARLVPADLRAPEGTVWRTLVGHMTAHITCVERDVYDVMVMRSMAATLLHDLTEAANAVAARQGPLDSGH